MSDIVERLRDCISYNPDTGILSWKFPQNNGKIKTGSEVGYLSHGYRRFGFDGKKIHSHIAAWAIFYGEWPARIVDHINCDPLDNRISNLRLASKEQNSFNQRISKNNKTGLKGVQERKNGKFHAEICVRGRRIALGSFSDKIDAAKAYNAAAILHYGEFARVNQI